MVQYLGGYPNAPDLDRPPCDDRDKSLEGITTTGEKVIHQAGFLRGPLTDCLVQPRPLNPLHCHLRASLRMSSNDNLRLNTMQVKLRSISRRPAASLAST